MPAWLEFTIYGLAAISIILAIGGLRGFADTKDPGLLVSSIVSIGFSSLAIYLPHWWPLVTGFAINIVVTKIFPTYARAPLPVVCDQCQSTFSVPGQEKMLFTTYEQCARDGGWHVGGNTLCPNCLTDDQKNNPDYPR